MGTIEGELNNILSGLFQADVEAKPGDYENEGLLYCGSCHTAKQRYFDFPEFGKPGQKTKRIVRCLCKCESQKREAEKLEQEHREEMMRIERLKDASLLEAKLRDVTFDTFTRTRDNEKLYTIARRYVDNFEKMYEERQGLLFWGTVGTGKSYTAACIANELLNKQTSVIMTSFVKILQNIGDIKIDESQYISRLNSAKLLIIDDLGTERDTGYAIEKIYNIIDSRYLSGKPLILTTNLTLQDMKNCEDVRYKRVYDRIFEMCYPVMVSGNSWRMNEAAKRFDKMKAMLEG